MARNTLAGRRERSDCAAADDPVSPAAWAAVSLLALLAKGHADARAIARVTALPHERLLPLLDVLEGGGLVCRDRVQRFGLAVPPQDISIARIVGLVDGNALRRTGTRDEAPEVDEILRRLFVTAADILDNFSLAEAAEG